jgi:hypothetical protein
MDVQQRNVLEVAAADENPKGAWAGAPSLAASTVAMTNTSGFPVEVSVVGGTYTVLKKNGVTLPSVTSAIMGTIPFRFRLAPGASYSITYSAAPTVTYTYA